VKVAVFTREYPPAVYGGAGVHVEYLVREEQTRAKPVALLGLRGAGKSTLGAKLAQALDMPFIELDREVEKEAGAELGEVFAMYGQDAYRRFERRALERVLAAEKGHAAGPRVEVMA